MSAYLERRKKYLMSTIQTHEIISTRYKPDIFKIKEDIVKSHYEHIKSCLLKRRKVTDKGYSRYEYKAEDIDIEDKIWLEPAIEAAKEARCNRIADFLVETLKGLEEYNRLLEIAKKDIRQSETLLQAADSMIKLGRLEEADKLIKEHSVHLKDARRRMELEG